MRLAYVSVETRGDVAVVRLEGEIDLSNAEEVRQSILDASSAAGMAIDLSGIAYLDSAGVRLLFEVARALGRRDTRLRLAVSEGSSVRRILDVARVEAIVPIDEHVDAAVEALGQTA
jgi:anti-anti-sigma factor